MKASPVQLLQSTIEKLSVEANADYSPSTVLGGEDVPLEVREICEPFPSFWEGQPLIAEGIAERTFMVRLALRTDPSLAASTPYPFEMIFSGVVACVPERLNGFTPGVTARQYGLAMIYGAMREQFLVMTSRMPHGPRLLPTVSFMEPDPGQSSSEAITTSSPALSTAVKAGADSSRAKLPKRVVGAKKNPSKAG